MKALKIMKVEDNFLSIKGTKKIGKKKGAKRLLINAYNLSIMNEKEEKIRKFWSLQK